MQTYTSLNTSERGVVIGRQYTGGGDGPQPPPPRRGVWEVRGAGGMAARGSAQLVLLMLGRAGPGSATGPGGTGGAGWAPNAPSPHGGLTVGDGSHPGGHFACAPLETRAGRCAGAALRAGAGVWGLSRGGGGGNPAALWKEL